MNLTWIVATLVTTMAVPIARASGQVHGAMSVRTPAQLPTRDSVISITKGAYDPVVSPDGERIAFGLLGGIWEVAADGGEAVRVDRGGGWAHHPAWSPDGGAVAWVRDTPASTALILRTLATGTERVLHARGPDDAVGSEAWGVVYSFGRVRFHPTDGRLYFVDFRQGIRSVDRLGRARTPLQVLPGSGRIGRPGISELSGFDISPDGTTMVVERDTTDLWSVVARVDERTTTLVTPVAPRMRRSIAWHPDGQSVVFVERSGAVEDLVHLSLAGVERRRIPLGPAIGHQVALAADGERAVLVARRQLEWIDLATGSRTPIRFHATVRPAAGEPGDLVIRNARVFTGTEDATRDGASVVVRGGRVEAILGRNDPVPAHLPVLDAEGRFLMPALTDAHAHIWEGSTFLQAGILTRGIARNHDAGSSLSATLNLRDAIRLGLVEGPAITTTGPAIDGPGGRARPFLVSDATDPGEVRELVEALAESGVDAIKLYAFLERPALRAAVEASHALGLRVTADLVATSWQDALDAGVDGFIHIMDHKWRFVARTPPPPDAGPWAVVDPDSAIASRFFEKVAAAGGMFDPTLMASARVFVADSFAAALGPGLADSAATHRVRTVAALMRWMHQAGVTWVAGTDRGPADLVEELRAYEAVGLPRAEVLRSATSHVARWLGRDDFGAIAPGRVADLILVDGDPLRTIADLERVVAVIQRGRVVLAR